MRTCSDCGNEFSSDGSYRVHKHRFHRTRPVAEQIAQEVPSEPEPEEEEVKLVSRPEPQAPDSEPVHRTRSGSSGSSGTAGALIIGGIILGLGALALKKWLEERDR